MDHELFEILSLIGLGHRVYQGANGSIHYTTQAFFQQLICCIKKTVTAFVIAKQMTAFPFLHQEQQFVSGFFQQAVFVQLFLCLLIITLRKLLVIRQYAVIITGTTTEKEHPYQQRGHLENIPADVDHVLLIAETALIFNVFSNFFIAYPHHFIGLNICQLQVNLVIDHLLTFMRIHDRINRPL